MKEKYINTIIAIISALSMTGISATIINIPADYVSIQAGIDACNYHDTILVQPGIYVENIEINGGILTLGSLFLTTADPSYIEQTVIDGDARNSVIRVIDCELTEIIGFTITNGSAYEGGGIACYNSELTISNNLVNNCFAQTGGGGILASSSDVIMRSNAIMANTTFD